MGFILMPESIAEPRICRWCEEEYIWESQKWADEKNPTVFVFSGSKNQMWCPNCGERHEPISYVGTHFEKRPTLKGEGAELFNRIKKRNYGSNMPDY